MQSRKPSWLRAKLPTSPTYQKVRNMVDENNLHTVCHSAQCPNMGECWSRGTATLMILGNICTRACTFCAVTSGKPQEYDLGEPARVAEAVARMNLKHCVITSVARDDLQDGGAEVWARTIRAVRNRCPGTSIEVLTPDFRGKTDLLDIVLDAAPDIFNHNLETVERLQKPVRRTSNYEHTFKILKHASDRGFTTKSGLMLGIGEKPEELYKAFKDLRDAGTNILTLGQYLQPSAKHAPIDRWVTPEEFAQWKQHCLGIGFDVVESGPLVRSSYHAEEQTENFSKQKAGAA